MRAVTWQGRREVAVNAVPDPRLIEPDDVIIEVTSAAICGSDLVAVIGLGPVGQLAAVLKPGMDS